MVEGNGPGKIKSNVGASQLNKQHLMSNMISFFIVINEETVYIGPNDCMWYELIRFYFQLVIYRFCITEKILLTESNALNSGK